MRKRISAVHVSSKRRSVKRWWFAALATGAALSASSCAGTARPPESRGAEHTVAQKRPETPEKRPAPILSRLSPTAQGFLGNIQDHVRKGDWAWVAEQSDSSFLRAMEGRPRDAYFFTYLFSAGLLSSDSPNDAQRFETLPIANVRDMTWDSVSVEGPVAVVKGRFLLSRGESVPFALRLVWRIEPPRILGTQP